jgi:hypothetical protein
MTADISAPGSVRDAAPLSHAAGLRTLVLTAGICWSILFVVIGLYYQLQFYADGSLFSYAVTVQDAWALHWHNIPGRLFVYLFCYVPAQTTIALTGDTRSGIFVYGFLFFPAPLLGLAATFAADRSKGRIVFQYACASTACLCPLVFGFPTEMWMTHALFWPALALCLYARRGIAGTAAVFAALLALAFTYEGALLLEAAVLAGLLLRGIRDRTFLRAAGSFLVVVAIWGFVKIALPPDDYVVPILARATLHFFDVAILVSPLFLLLLGALAGHAIAFLVLRRLSPANAHVGATAIVAAALAGYWLWFDQALHSDNRYYMRTVLLLGMLLIGTLAAVHVVVADGRLYPRIAFLRRLMAALTHDLMQAGIGAILVVALVHAVETAKFVGAWTQYKNAARALAMGAASDPLLGDARFVSSERIGADLNRLSWFSTTHFLSVLVAPGFAPSRLVVDPQATYFSFSCATATANEQASRAVPAESRRLVRVYICLHR